MNEASSTDTPGPREQIAGLNFAMLLVGPDMAVREVNPAGEDLLGSSASRFVGRDLFDCLELAEPRFRESICLLYTSPSPRD